MAWTAPRTWVAGEDLTATNFNTHIRDNEKMLSDTWTAFTPTWTAATTNPVLGNGSFDAAYMQLGKWVRFRILLTMGSTTTYGSGAWFLTLPANPLNMRWLFVGVARDVSANNSYWCGMEYDTTLPMRLRIMPTTAGNQMATVTSTTPFTWATTDTLFLSGEYEAA